VHPTVESRHCKERALIGFGPLDHFEQLVIAAWIARSTLRSHPSGRLFRLTRTGPRINASRIPACSSST
jgi:hypothetical protein